MRALRPPSRAPLLVVLLASAHVAHAQVPAEPTPADRLLEARTVLEGGNLERADALLAPLAADPNPRVAAMALFLRGDVADHRLRFADARADYLASMRTDPGSRYAARAHGRVEYLDAHGEGDFAPLATLERVRSNARLSSDPQAIDALAVAMRSFPPGSVRAETLLLLGQAYAGRLHRPAEAIPLLRQLATDRGASRDARGLAIDLLKHAEIDSEHLDEALHDMLTLHAPAESVAEVRQLIRRRLLERLALGTVAVTLLAGLLAFAQALRKRQLRPLMRAWLRPLPINHLLLLSLGGAWLAHTHDAHSMSPFFAFGGGAFAVYLTATTWNLVGSSRAGWRIVRAVTCAMGMLAVSFAVMHHYDVQMLEGIGL